MNKRERACDAQVLDRAALARVAQWIEKHRPDAVSQPTLWRLTRKKKSAIGAETLATFEAVLIEEGQSELFEQLHNALLPPGGVARRRTYERWAKGQLDRFLDRDGPRHHSVGKAEWFIKHDGPGESVIEFQLGREVRGDSLRRWENLCALIHRVLASDAGPRLKAFRAAFRDLRGLEGHYRYIVALLNILGPLLEGPETDFVERQWEELEDAELCAFVKAGIERERILLNRPPLRSRLRDASVPVQLSRARIRTFADDWPDRL